MYDKNFISNLKSFININLLRNKKPMPENYVFSLCLRKIYSALFKFIHNGHFTVVVVKYIEYTVTTSWVVSYHSNLQELFKVNALNG